MNVVGSLILWLVLSSCWLHPFVVTPPLTDRIPGLLCGFVMAVRLCTWKEQRRYNCLRMRVVLYENVNDGDLSYGV